MPDSTSQPPPPHNTAWENGWTPDTSRAPGTRRLWLAGALALTTIAVCATAIVITDKEPDDTARTKEATDPSSIGADGPGLLSFASPSKKGTPTPDEHKPASEKSPTASDTGAEHSATPSAKAPAPSKSASSHGGSSSSGSSGSSGSSSGSSSSSTAWKSVRSVNYPDRYWQVSGDYVKLNPAGSATARRASTFKVVKGLAKSSCYSFTTADGSYLRHRNFILRAEHNDGSSLFKQDATFCPRTSSYSGAVMLESVNYPGRYLRHQNFQLKLDQYQNSSLYRADSAFRLVAGLN
ncbi:AbfB domain-containing protein [Streptomyces sp. STR69]|uniref:AbfB domain-containing protein n=1 Tax=Streptomyces sp. STR69 TaxID=1796942 RepID=UPI0021C71C48|nr:AbfB domain-containing protein [Streptomyces sp. STR69]